MIPINNNIILCYNHSDKLMTKGVYMIRDAKEKDISEILEIFNYAIIHTTAIYDYIPHTIEQRERWFRQRKEQGMPVIVYEEDNRILGFGSYGLFRPHPAYKYSVEHSIYVKPDFQNKGIGSKLLKSIIDIADKNGYAMLIGVIDSNNEKSIKLHETHRFIKTGKLNKVGYKFNGWLDVVLMQLELSGPNNPMDG